MRPMSVSMVRDCNQPTPFLELCRFWHPLSARVSEILALAKAAHLEARVSPSASLCNNARFNALQKDCKPASSVRPFHVDRVLEERISSAAPTFAYHSFTSKKYRKRAGANGI